MLYNNVGTTLCAKVLVVGTRKRKVSLFVTPTVTSSPTVTSTAPDKDDGFYLFPQFLYLCLYLNVYLCFIWQECVLLFLLQFWQCLSLKMKTSWTVFSRQQRKCLTLIKRVELLRRFNWIGNNTNSTLRPGGAHFVWIRQVSKTH